MHTSSVNPFTIVGITIRASNTDPVKLVQDMTGLWGRFMSENIMQVIPNKLSHDIFCVYTDYEGDHTKPYSVVLGCQVGDVEAVPAGLVARQFKGGKYTKRIAHGNLHAGVVHEAWKNIWADSSLPRAYEADWEVYGADAQNPEHASVDIYVCFSSDSYCIDFLMWDEHNVQYIRETDGDAASSKMSCVHAGYYSDPFLPALVGSVTQRIPIINYGYYTRVSAIRRVTREFSTAFCNRSVQVVTLGAGSDTHGFWALRELDNLVYFEVDFPEAVSAKVLRMSHKSSFFQSACGIDVPGAVFPQVQTLHTNNGVAWRLGRMTMIGFDITGDLDELMHALKSSGGFSPDLPTLFISECCMIYLDTPTCDRVLSWISAQVSTVAICIYEQVNGGDQFGKIMVENMNRRRCPLLSLMQDTRAQEHRLMTSGFRTARSMYMDELSGKFTRKRIELIDEWEEFNLLQRHYVLTVGINCESAESTTSNQVMAGIFDTTDS